MRMLAFLCVAASLATIGASGETSTKKPRLELRASPRFTFPPADVFVVAELSGGDDVEEYYCPEVEWEWDDGARSVRQSDCDPFDAQTAIERRFSGEHRYRSAGDYTIRLTMRHASRALAVGTVHVMVRSRGGVLE